MKEKLIVGITIPGSVGLLEGQLFFFKDKGYDTYLMSPKDQRSVDYCEREECVLLDITIARNISIFQDVKSLFQIIGVLKKIEPNIVNFGTPKISLLGLLAAKYCGVHKRIYTCRGFRFEHEKGFFRWLLKKMDTVAAYCSTDIICISDSVKDLGVSEGIFPEKKCNVINRGSSNGLNLKKFNIQNISKDSSSILKDKLLIQKEDFVYGFLGRIIDRKGINELFQVYKELYATNKNFKLLVVGPFDDSQIQDTELHQKMIDHPGVILAGRTDNVPLFLSIMDVFVLPAWWEGFGNVLIQAAAMGIPVISTFGTGTRDAVNDKYNGLLVPLKDNDKLKQAMLELYLNDEKRIEYGKNGIEWSKKFDSKIIWNGMMDIYKKNDL
jgi:glycosyltransferase involved in cell wall biosynthesis